MKLNEQPKNLNSLNKNIENDKEIDLSNKNKKEY